MEVIIKRGHHTHHGIVTNVWLERHSFEFVHLTGDVVVGEQEHIVENGKGEADCQKIQMIFGKEDIGYYVYEDNIINPKMETDRDIIKFRAMILSQIFHTFDNVDDIMYDVREFNCEHFASYCVAGLAYSNNTDIQQRLNKKATAKLDNE